MNPEANSRGYADYAFIGGAQIDMYGNISSTIEGSYYNKPDIRFPGSGGAGAMAANCGKPIDIMALEKRRFAKQLDFITSIGYGDGSLDDREKEGVMVSGPYRVTTQQALFGFDEKTKRMKLLEVRPGFRPQQIQDMIKFEFIIPPKVPEMAEPTEEDMHLLRDVIDAEGYRAIKK
jgi:glutaconate CoA-transferase subunit B